MKSYFRFLSKNKLYTAIEVAGHCHRVCPFYRFFCHTGNKDRLGH